jgi:DNA-binding protein HU-beta
MNKTEFVRAMAEESGLSLKDAGAALDAFMEVTKKVLVSGEGVNLIGFGSFEVAERSARPGRDFKTGKMINVPASRTVKFKVGKTLKDAVKA